MSGSFIESAFLDVCNVFGIAKLNKYQEDAIKYVVNEKKDVFVNLPTGFGKSIIFQALPIDVSPFSSTRAKHRGS